MTSVSNSTNNIQNPFSTNSQDSSSTANQSGSTTVDSLKTRIEELQLNAEEKRLKQLNSNSSSTTRSNTIDNDSNKTAQANCPSGQGGTTNQRSLAIETNRDIEEAKKILQEIQQSSSLSRTDKINLAKQLKTAFETMDSFFQLEQQLLNSSVQRAESQAKADRGYADGMSARERRKDKGAANEQARASEIRVGDLRSDLVLAQSNKMQVAGVLQSINSSMFGFEMMRTFNRS